jgi:hypothetical protein
MDIIQTTIIVTPLVLIVEYFSRLTMAFALALTIKTDSKGMAHLKHQQHNKYYTW